MADVTFPIVFDKCPKCHSDQTVTRLAARVAGLPDTTFVSAEQTQAALADTWPPIGLTVKVLFVHHDYCAVCGHRYTTKVEIRTVPANAFHQQVQGFQQRQGH